MDLASRWTETVCCSQPVADVLHGLAEDRVLHQLVEVFFEGGLCFFMHFSVQVDVWSHPRFSLNFRIRCTLVTFIPNFCSAPRSSSCSLGLERVWGLRWNHLEAFIDRERVTSRLQQVFLVPKVNHRDQYVDSLNTQGRPQGFALFPFDGSCSCREVPIRSRSRAVLETLLDHTNCLRRSALCSCAVLHCRSWVDRDFWHLHIFRRPY